MELKLYNNKCGGVLIMGLVDVIVWTIISAGIILLGIKYINTFNWGFIAGWCTLLFMRYFTEGRYS